MASNSVNWQDKADGEWRIVVRQVGQCERCLTQGIAGDKKGSWLNLQSHHIITRGHVPYRHMVENGICLCTRCHKFSEYSAHNDRTSFESWLKAYRTGVWEWYMEHTVEVEKVIGNEVLTVYKAIEIDHLGDKKEFEMLREMKLRFNG